MNSRETAITWDQLPAFSWLGAPMWAIDSDSGARIWSNQSGLAVWPEAADETLADIGLDLAGLRATMAAVRSGEIATLQWRRPMVRGGQLVNCRATSIVTPGGRLAALVEVQGAVPDTTEAERRAVAALQLTESLVCLYREDGHPLLRNPAAVRAFGSVGSDHSGFVRQLGNAQRADEARRAILSGGAFSARVEVLTLGGRRWHDVRCRKVSDPASGEPMLLVDAQDATEAQAAEERLQGEKRLLEMVSRAVPLDHILETLVREAERDCPGLLCSVMEVRDGRLFTRAAPSLPRDYTASIEALPIGPAAGSCGTACHRGTPVIVTDIATDPLWDDHRHLALPHGLRACWSVPLIGSDGRVLGTFAGYYRSARSPSATELQALEFGRHVATIAIEREHARSAIERARDQLQTILDALPMVISYVNREERYEFLNRAFELWFGTTRGAALGRPSWEIIGRELHEKIAPLTARALAGEEIRYERQGQDAQGRARHLEVHYLPHVAASGRVLGHFGILHDITDHKDNARLLEHLATHDQLTKLPNRTLFSEHLAMAFARAERHHHRLAVLFVDLDRFKNVNDTMGHDAGDRLLHIVATRFRASVRASDTVARLGGDEFVVLVEEVGDSQEAAGLAQKLIQVLTEPAIVDGQELYVSASVGIAVGPEDGADPATLLKHADIAMYRAKHQGRNGYQFFSAEATAASFEQLMLESALRRALERQEFVLCFQPIVNLVTGEVEGAETLVRWRHPELGLVAPGRFIPLAEETGLIVPVGAWVLEEACRIFATDEALAALRVAVNLSPRQFRVRDLDRQITEVLARTGLDPRRLDLEVTESTMMENPDAAARILQSLRDLGVRISIDDFGTGYSSLSFLKRFPIDTLKVDQSFVRDVVDDEDDASIARAVIAMGRSLRMTITAEGVETPDQLAFLRSEACHRAQGFYFSRPLEIAAFRQWLATRGTGESIR